MHPLFVGLVRVYLLLSIVAEPVEILLDRFDSDVLSANLFG